MNGRGFLDTNVLLDHLADRKPFAQAATAIWNLSERRQIIGCVSALSFSTIYYVVRRHHDRASADRAMRMLSDVFEVVAIDDGIIRQALGSAFPDFEDAMQYCCAARSGADCLITRDPSHFRNASILVLGPDEYLAQRALHEGH